MRDSPLNSWEDPLIEKIEIVIRRFQKMVAVQKETEIVNHQVELLINSFNHFWIKAFIKGASWNCKICRHLIWSHRIKDKWKEKLNNSKEICKRLQPTIEIHFFHQSKKERIITEVFMELTTTLHNKLYNLLKHPVADTTHQFKTHIHQGKSTKCAKKTQLSSEAVKTLLLIIWL